MSYNQTQLLQQLLPPGTAFSNDASSNTVKLLTAIAAEPTRTVDAVNYAISEANPGTMNVNGPMLDVRYTEAGLPDPCRGVPATRELQQLEILGRWSARGGQTAAYLQAQLQAYGYQAYVREYVISGPSDPNNHKFKVNYVDNTTGVFRAGVNRADDWLETGAAVPNIACLIERLKPAHTNYVLTAYTTDLAASTAP